ncbi:uncharacterized protein EKO05_0004608 [Ascochyta rabiei]|uniref:Uncharacterized protein n=1 Tax=Didymella rabiei TaxID=5454 RepID=A0A163EZQ4_DIDRA|nr:uncharacterized protein EKO05_0004608 [Ascochyta rabiei]KZM24042.1 hypothetical protein ST47_g4811 [Ascochyta rabiei]UPX14117.1 hypothetical protein EKO05_0004608 [Ascochyta rabiei]
MSGVEVVAAVSAIVSAFHAGSELLKHIKAKRRKARAQAQQEFEEKQLQDSLVSGEQQIGSRYAQDMREMGDLVRVGDSIARDRLLHIAVMLQMEIIKSLQMAAKHETAILNLQILHEASIMNRKDTFVTLNEMKQRLIMTRPMTRQIEDDSGQRSSVATLPSSRSSTFDSYNTGHVPAAVTLGPQGESNESRSGLARYFQMKRNSSTSAKSASTANTSTEKPNINYSAALEELVRTRGEDRATIMRDIDEIMVSYKGLDIGQGTPHEPWGQNQLPKSFGRRDTWTVLNGDGSPRQDTFAQNWDPMQTVNHTLPPSQAYPGPNAQNHAMFNQDVFPGHQQHPSYAAPSPYPHYQTQTSHRFSDSSTSSAPFSERSWERNGSDSSRSSCAPSDPRLSVQSHLFNKSACSPSTSPNATFHDHHGQRLALPTSYAPTDETYTSPIAPLAVPQRSPLRASSHNGASANALVASPNTASSPSQSSYTTDQQRSTRVPDPIAPFASPPDSAAPKEENRTDPSPSRPNLVSPDVRGPPSSHSSSSGHTVVFGVPSAPWHRAVSAPIVDRIRQPSIASTDSSSSGSIGVIPRPPGAILSSTIQSPKPGQERMMGGRPCRDNNYWGFCKGAWDVREDVKKGLAVRNMPSGMYNTKEVWECRQCNFRGNTYTFMHPGKKGKKETVVDPNIHTSKSGIRYRWIFLAKSHVKKKTPDSASEECNYGCVICSVELKVTSIFGNLDTLMYHLLEHVSDMTQTTMKQTRCIVGRTAGAEEDWDINMPLFADVSEVEG